MAQLRGGEPLEAEQSINYALGGIYENGSFLLTFDYFRIELSDRLAVTQNFELTAEEVEQLLAEGVTSAANLQNFRFFVNDFDTRTEGLDLVATWVPAKIGGDTTFSLIFNHTETTVTKFNPATLDGTRIRELQEALPETRYNVSVNHHFNEAFRVLGRVSYFDSWFDSEDVQSYGDEITVDLELAYTWNNAVTFVLGGQNVFDTFPDENPGALSVGNLYSQYTPFGFNGAFYYARLQYKW